MLSVLLTAACRGRGEEPAPDLHAVHDFIARRGMVVAAHPLAAQAGVDVLRSGGNAVDAAVATAFALGVVEPYSSGLGGGGFMLILPGGNSADHSSAVAILDYREVAPAAASRDMYKDHGKVVPGLSTVGHLAAGVPGTVAGLAQALETWGTMSLEQVMAPAIKYAEQGFEADAKFYQASLYTLPHLRKYKASAKTLLNHGMPYAVGDIIKQPELAKTLRTIAEHGAEGFYKGWIAEAIAREMQENGGLITKEDLAGYKPRWRTPVTGTYRGYTIVSMPPPSSGGTHIIQMLNILEGYDLAAMGYESARGVHILAEAMRRAFADRAEYMGDPAFTDIPLDMLLSKEYAAALRKNIDQERATPSADISPGNGYFPEGPSTTHLSVVDRYGGAVSLTQTVNTAFGSCVVVPGTGILLNNEMDDFSADPGTPNAYGLIQGEANSIAPGKIPLSSMSPSMVFKDDELFLVIGSPGGPRIITTVLQVMINVIDFNMDIARAVSAPRIHHQWLPDKLLVEPARLGPAGRMKLLRMGHNLGSYFMAGNAQAIIRHSGGDLQGYSDPRGVGRTMGY